MHCQNICCRPDVSSAPDGNDARRVRLAVGRERRWGVLGIGGLLFLVPEIAEAIVATRCEGVPVRAVGVVDVSPDESLTE